MRKQRGWVFFFSLCAHVLGVCTQSVWRMLVEAIKTKKKRAKKKITKRFSLLQQMPLFLLFFFYLFGWCLHQLLFVKTVRVFPHGHRKERRAEGPTTFFSPFHSCVFLLPCAYVDLAHELGAQPKKRAVTLVFFFFLHDRRKRKKLKKKLKQKYYLQTVELWVGRSMKIVCLNLPVREKR